jgi:diaminohydroxyphosphoribosylaminopyrimidine deaminase/5-amino-6-(5-phosphoribosylamino)uracil reductase
VIDDAALMAHALALGRRAAGTCWPNPAVGCVIVQGGRIVGRSWTQAGGRPHAEAMALAQAGARARGGTAFVTLEPCAHLSARGPACADSLIAAGLVRVVTALTDPDPRTAGQGHARLRAAGLQVTEGVGAAEAADDLAGFLSRVTGGPVAVTLKLAMTLDGRIATRTGVSRWITGPGARRDVHLARARHDAVMVGIGTALADDPDLTVRDIGVAHQPVRVVLDSRLRLPLTARLAQTIDRAPLWLVHGPEADPALQAAWVAQGAKVIGVGGTPSLDPAQALRALAAHGLNAVYCEGGGQLAAGLIAAGLVRRLVIYQAGRLFGAGGTPGIGDLPVTAIPPGAGEWRLTGAIPVGDDLRTSWVRKA